MADKVASLAQKNEAIKKSLETIKQGFADRLQKELLTDVKRSRNQRFVNRHLFLGIVALSVIFIAVIISRSISRPLYLVISTLSARA
jgi:AAA+ ATPase superfamily predicted ATPase